MYRCMIMTLFMLFTTGKQLCSQHLPDTISEEKAAAIMQVLASDAMQGRGNGSAALLKAGLFIGDQFAELGLVPLPGSPGFYLPFRPFQGNELTVPDILEWNGVAIPPAQFMYLRPQPGNYASKQLSDFRVIRIDSCFSEELLEQYRGLPGNILLWTSRLQPDGENFFPEIMKMPAGGLQQDFLLVYSLTPPDSLTLSGFPGYYSKLGYNIAAMLPGKSRPGEVVLFSAHYDHIGISGYNVKDSIMNGANDDASGVTALLLLAEYFALKRDNERTLLFCAFAGEELGLLGSGDFIRRINPVTIVAGINIEMIGVPQYGKGTVFITGEQQSELPDLLSRGLKLAKIRTTREPNEEKQLFRRSDNYTFFKAGVPAHTIMSSDDDEPCYHLPCDEMRRINIPHLTRITKGIAVATASIINGTATPSRNKTGK